MTDVPIISPTAAPVPDQPAATAALAPKGPRRAAVLFIFFTALLDVVAMGLMIPVLPNLIKHFVGAGLDDAGATARAAHYTLYFTLTWGTMQFFFGPILGMLSDRFGRRPVLLISNFGLGVDYLFMALAPSLSWLFIGRVINGATSASFSTASAYVADVTAPQDRAKAFGMIGAAFGVGFIIGPALGGLLGQIDLRLPFFLSAGLAMCNWLYGFFILPESLPKERRSPALNWKRANPISAFGLLVERPSLAGLSLVMILFQLSQNVFPSIFILFVGHRWHWGPAVAGSAMMLTGLLTMLVQVFLVQRVVKAIGERGALLIGLISALGSFLVYGLAPSWPIFLCAAPLWALGALIGPGAQSLMSRRVPAQQQGRLQGVNAAFMGVCSIIGPVIYLTSLQYAVKTEASVHVPGLPILIAAGFCVCALVAAWFLAKPVADADALVTAPIQP
jgi:DHA1 family tetracycline resistance protein-like MFS transporter